jgi:SAM-dependent methyltransferase
MSTGPDELLAPDTPTDLVASQLAYYRARASEYDDVFVDYQEPALPAALERLRTGGMGGDILELACGTGYWTRFLSPLGETVTALDGSAEMIAEATARQLANVEFHQADLFTWRPERRWDAVFFGHWLAHVPDDRFDDFWATIRDAVKPAGVVEFVDVTSHERRIETPDHHDPDTAVMRTLADGRQFRVVKIFRDPHELKARLSRLGWTCRIDEIHPGFQYASCYP